MKKKTISIMVPTYNEEENVVLMYDCIGPPLSYMRKARTFFLLQNRN